MMQWIYTEYFTIYTQYLTYFTTVLMLLTSASVLSFIKSMDSKKLNYCELIFFCISCIVAIIDIYVVFIIHESIRTELLLMSGKCRNFGGEIACDVNIQEYSSYLRIGILLLIASFISLIIGYVIKFRSKL